MSGTETMVESLRPPSKRLYKSSVCLAACLRNHQEASYGSGETSGGTAERSAGVAPEKPTLAALARHYRLGQLLRAIAPLIFIQERLFRRLEKRPNTSILAKETFPDLFNVMEHESREILKISGDFSVEKEDRHAMEDNLNRLRESVERITDAFQAVQDAQYESPGHLNNKLSDIVDELRVNWTAVRSVRESLPERYQVHYGLLQEKPSSW